VDDRPKWMVWLVAAFVVGVLAFLAATAPENEDESHDAVGAGAQRYAAAWIL
jgi:hypothetical protein